MLRDEIALFRESYFKYNFHCFARKTLNSNKRCTELTSNNNLPLLSLAFFHFFVIRGDNQSFFSQPKHFPILSPWSSCISLCFSSPPTLPSHFSSSIFHPALISTPLPPLKSIEIPVASTASPIC